MEDLIKKMEEHISDISSVEEIDQCITKMRPAVEYFFDKTRREWAEGRQSHAAAALPLLFSFLPHRPKAAVPAR